MTKSEYQEPVEFIGPKLDALEERLTRVEVLREEDRGLILGVAEGVTTNGQKMTREFAAIRAEMAEGFTSVWSGIEIVWGEMTGRIEGLRTEMVKEFKAVRAEIAGAPRIGPSDGFQS